MLNYQSNDYSFKPHFFSLPTGENIHYIDEGKGHPVIMIHGNPTWSYFYRNVVNVLKGQYRTIVPDHLGMGLSDLPRSSWPKLEDHINNLENLLDRLDIKEYSLIVHDWGGPIGIGASERYPERLKKLVIMNTAAFTGDYIPWQINICRTPILGDWAMRRLNGFARAALTMAVSKPLTKNTKKGFIFPYHDYKRRTGIARFVQDIPMGPTHPSWSRLKNVEDKLPLLTCPKLVLWGEKDFCFNQKFLARWKNIYPDATYITLKDAGHYLLEDATDECIGHIQHFLRD